LACGVIGSGCLCGVTPRNPRHNEQQDSGSEAGRCRSDDVIPFHKQQGFTDLGHGMATRMNANHGIRMKVGGNWQLNFEYDLRYNSLAVAEQNTTDTNNTFELSYNI
jgi:uncharacterized protein DUF481